MTLQEKYNFKDEDIREFYFKCLEKMEDYEPERIFTFEGSEITLEFGVYCEEISYYACLYECWCDDELNESDELTDHILKLFKTLNS